MQQATTIFNRMTEVEKINVRAASPDGLDYLGETSFRVDLPLHSFEDRSAVMRELYALCMLEFATKCQGTGWSGVTWKH